MAAVLFGVPIGVISLGKLFEGISEWKFQRRRDERRAEYDERRGDHNRRRRRHELDQARETEARAARALMMASREIDPIETETRDVVARACELYEQRTGRRTRRPVFRRAVAAALDDLRERMAGDDLDDIRDYLRKKEQAAHARRVKDRKNERARFDRKKQDAAKRFGQGVADLFDSVLVDADDDYSGGEYGEASEP